MLITFRTGFSFHRYGTRVRATHQGGGREPERCFDRGCRGTGGWRHVDGRRRICIRKLAIRFRTGGSRARAQGVEREPSDRRADAHVVKLAGLSRQTHFDIAQAFAVGQLREGHDAKLLGATKAARPVIAAVTIDDAMEGLPRQEVHDLHEQGLAEVRRLRGGETRNASANRYF